MYDLYAVFTSQSALGQLLVEVTIALKSILDACSADRNDVFAFWSI